MGTQDAANKALATATPVVSIQSLIQNSAKELGQALPAHLNPERLVRIALTSIRLNPALAKCTPESFLGSLFVLAQIGLEPIAGRAYLLPFNNKRKTIRNGKEEWGTYPEVQAVIGYKGLVELFYRHEAALSIDMHTVYEKDEFQYEYGTESYIRHKPAFKDRGLVVGYYVVAKMKGGANIFKFMTIDECLEHGKKHSKTWDKTNNCFYPSSPWAKEPDAMCMKTVLIQLAKLLPLSVELQSAIAVDETAREYRKGIEQATDLPVTTTWEEEAIPGEAEKLPQNGQETAAAATISPETTIIVCQGCDKVINEAEKSYSQAKFKKTLCRDCQREESKRGQE